MLSTNDVASEFMLDIFLFTLEHTPGHEKKIIITEIGKQQLI